MTYLWHYATIRYWVDLRQGTASSSLDPCGIFEGVNKRSRASGCLLLQLLLRWPYTCFIKALYIRSYDQVKRRQGAIPCLRFDAAQTQNHVSERDAQILLSLSLPWHYVQRYNKRIRGSAPSSLQSKFMIRVRLKFLTEIKISSWLEQSLDFQQWEDCNWCCCWNSN